MHMLEKRTVSLCSGQPARSAHAPWRWGTEVTLVQNLGVEQMSGRHHTKMKYSAEETNQSSEIRQVPTLL